MRFNRGIIRLHWKMNMPASMSVCACVRVCVCVCVRAYARGYASVCACVRACARTRARTCVSPDVMAANYNTTSKMCLNFVFFFEILSVGKITENKGRLKAPPPSLSGLVSNEVDLLK